MQRHHNGDTERSNSNKIIIIIPLKAEASASKITKYTQLSSTRIYSPEAIETTGTWQHQAGELVQKLGRRATNVSGDSERPYTSSSNYQWLCKSGTNAVSFHNTYYCKPVFFLLFVAT